MRRDFEIQETNCLDQPSNHNKILFINLSDEGELGRKSTEALRQDENNKVTYLQLLDYAKIYQNINSKNNDLPQELLTIDFNYFDEFIIGIHGFKDDRLYAYNFEHTEEREYNKLFTALELAGFIEFILTKKEYDPEKKLLIKLSMCYGGRIDNYEEIYQKDLKPKVFKKSFAYQLIASFSEKYNIELSAYTGVTGIDEGNGKLWVQTEEQVKKAKNIKKIKAKGLKAFKKTR